MQILIEKKGFKTITFKNMTGIHVFYANFLELLGFMYQSIKHGLNFCASFYCLLMV